MIRDEQLMRDLPDADSARRFLGRLSELDATAAKRLREREPLLSDVLALVAFSPLLATTMLQNIDYIWWLDKRRVESGVRGKTELLESLARFALTNSQVEPSVMFARFRRRELLRIYLRDIRGLATIAEITEEISNLADAILESALEHARREADNRFGAPQETNDKGRSVTAKFCVAALGKLGSRELNYSSDIDLFFIYSGEGNTNGSGSRDAVTNREYFVKLAEFVIKLIGGSDGAYRVDVRLRPHGTLGALAMSVGDTVKYYKKEARAWEQQVLIRSRGCAGDIELFAAFYDQVESVVYPADEDIAAALANVRLSKEKIDHENINSRGYNVKLGRGGIREIEFLAQALQRAFGGRDKWLRIGHTLISLARLADRELITSQELTQLSAAYAFLRRTEHILQMENGVQTHSLPLDEERLALLARRNEFAGGGKFDVELDMHRDNVSRVFTRVFGDEIPRIERSETFREPTEIDAVSHLSRVIETAGVNKKAVDARRVVIDELERISPHFSAYLSADPHLAATLPLPGESVEMPDHEGILMAAVESKGNFGERLTALRKVWPRLLFDIVIPDLFGEISLREAKRRQTSLAEATIKAALFAVEQELVVRCRPHKVTLDLSILALGKLGGRGLDYGSDLDLVIVYFDPNVPVGGMTAAEFYSRAVELFTNALSAMTRDGSLYRVDLRLRPFGTKGVSAISVDAFLNYVGETAAVWEMLAFVKMRFVGGEPSIGQNVEAEMRQIIHERAVNIDAYELRNETRKMRLALENRKKVGRKHGADIKFGPGGMLDIYFAVRYLQLRDNIPDNEADRSTTHMLGQLREANSLDEQLYEELLAGYTFLLRLDHALRLIVGRTMQLPEGNVAMLDAIAARMKVGTGQDLLEKLTEHRLVIRNAFDTILPAD